MVNRKGFRIQDSGFGVLCVICVICGCAFAQQPQAQQGQPLSAINAKYANGVAPGYWPTAGSGLTLNLSAGSVMCQSVATNYAGGMLSMTASQTNYVFLNPTMNCAPFATTSPFVAGEIPIAVVVTGSSAIASVTDARTWFTTTTGVDVDPFRVSVKDCGAYGDGIHDDTAAIQTCLDKFTNGIAAIASGTLYFPRGTYNISGTLYYVGDVGHTFRMLGIGQGQGSQIVCTGPGCAMAMFITMGMNQQSGVEKIWFNGNGYATKGVWYSSTNGVGGTFTEAVSTGTQTVTVSSTSVLATGSLLNVDSGANTEFVVVSAVGSGTITATFAKSHLSGTAFGNSPPAGGGATFKDLFISGIIGSPSWGVAIGCPFADWTNEAAALNLVNVNVGGAGLSGPPTYGIGTLNNGNVQDFYITNGNIGGTQYGINFFGNSGVTIKDVQMGGNGVDFLLHGEQAHLIGVESQGSSMFLSSGGAGGVNTNAVIIENCGWGGAAGSSDYVIATTDSLTIINSGFWNTRTTSSVAKVQMGSPLFPPANSSSGSTASFFSIGSFYLNATGYVPLYDGSNNVILPTYYASQPVAVTSINDQGGGGSNPIVRLNNYLSTPILTDSGCAWDVANSGLVRTCNGGKPVVFRNQAQTNDIIGMTTNSSDQVVLGGTPGVSATQYASTVPTGTPPLTVASTTPVTNFTVQNCDTCNITTSMTVGGGTPLHAMNLYNTASITPTAVTASSCSDQTFVVSGLLATDRVSSIAPPSALGNLSLGGHASAANTVLFHFCNPSSSSVTPPAGVYSFLAVH
jgi:hypothetical protein